MCSDILARLVQGIKIYSNYGLWESNGNLKVPEVWKIKASGCQWNLLVLQVGSVEVKMSDSSWMRWELDQIHQTSNGHLLNSIVHFCGRAVLIRLRICSINVGVDFDNYFSSRPS